MEQEPLVSIIISNYNYGQFIRDAIESALSQTYKFTEIIVVDDGSTDSSQKIISSYGDNIIPIFKEHKGHVSTWNVGFVKSQGSIVCFLDSDDCYLPNKVKQIVEAFGQNPYIGWCFHYLKNVDTYGSPLNLPEEKYMNTEDALINLRDAIIKGEMRIPYYAPPTSGLCFKRSVLSKILPMPESILIADDYCMKLAALYLSAGFHISEKLGIRRFHGANMSIRCENFKRVETEQSVIKIALYLRERFSKMSIFTDKMVARAIGRILAQKWKKLNEISEFNKYIQRYYSPAKWLIHSPRIAINMMRILYSKKVMFL